VIQKSTSLTFETSKEPLPQYSVWDAVAMGLVGILGLRHKLVTYGAGQNPGSPVGESK